MSEDPVVEMSPSRGIVVGVTDTDHGRRALRHAFMLARQSGASLWAVTAYPSSGDPDDDDCDQEEVAALAAQGRAVAEVIGVDRFAIALYCDAVAGDAETVLVELAAQNELLVVGQRFASPHPGSVSRACIAKASCPVLVIRADGTVAGRPT